MQNDKLLEFVWSDVWLILAITITDSGNGTTLKSIVAAGDYINHSIFTGAELRHGLAILTHAGYVNEIEGKYFITGDAKAYWATRQGTRKSINTLTKDFEKFLGAPPYTSQNFAAEDQKWQYPSLTDEMVHQAYQEYIQKSRTSKKMLK